MIQFATDTFTRANESPLASPWTGPSSANFNLGSNAVTPISLTQDERALYVLPNGLNWPADQYSQAAISVTGGTAGGGQGPGVAVRMAPSTVDELYRLTVNKGATNNVKLERRRVVGGGVDLAFRTTTWVDGDILKLSVEGQGPAVLKIYQNGSQLGADVVDASAMILSGNPGLTYSSTVTAATIDTWEGGGEPLGVPVDYQNFPKPAMRSQLQHGRVA